MQMLDEISLVFPPTHRWVSYAGMAAGEYAVRVGFGRADADHICLAVEEAALKAVRFGYGVEQDELRVSFARTGFGMHMFVRSRGVPLKEELLPRYDRERLAFDGDTTGLGSFLIRNMVDRVSFTIPCAGEREITMLKYFPPGRDKEGPSGEERGVSPEAGQQETACAIRLARPEDAEDISRLALRAHGSLLFCELIYYPAHVREMIESGEMISFVAETGSGRIVGHGALLRKEPGARVEEMTYGFVDPRFRGKGCSWDMAGSLLGNAVSRGVYAVFVLAVTNHERSQRSALHVGLRECALMLAASSASQAWRKGEDGLQERIGNLMLIRYLGEADTVPLFVPQRHRRMIGRIYDHLGAEMNYAADEGIGELPDTPARIRSISDFIEGWTLIFVSEYGSDIYSQVEEQLRLSCSQGVPVTYVLLPMDRPCAPSVSEELEKTGFFFAGVGPYADGRECLSLQYLNGVDPGYDSIRIHTEFGRELLAYVRSCSS